MKKIFLFLVFLFFSNSVFADLTPQQRLDDATQLINLYLHRYAPLTWKEELLGIEFEELAETLRDRAASAKNDLEFYDALLRFVSSLQDAHLFANIPSTHRSFLGFSVDDFNGEILITDIDRHHLSEEAFPFQVGDTLAALDEKPIDDVLETLMPYRTFGHTPANRRIAAIFLTFRPQALIPFIPRGKISVKGISSKNGEEITAELEWKHHGTPLAEFTEGATAIPFLTKAIALSKNDVLRTSFPLLSPQERWSEIIAGNLFPHDPFFPPWESFHVRETDPFVSGTLDFAGKKIGFIRINTWYFTNLDHMMDVFHFFAREIQYFQQNTDALIIDQAGNGGGNPCIMEAVAGMLIQGPFRGYEFRLKATRPWLLEFENALQQIKEAKLFHEAKLFEQSVEKIKIALKNGYAFTDPFPMCSLDGLLPQPKIEGKRILYTKPILLLINETACSAGDMFPALLQDAGVMTLGTRTAGCGGHIEIVDNLGFSDLTVSVTGSLIVRPKPTSSHRSEEHTS